ncbi:hypothetical protein D1007_40223 [Hordeum vulgare]|nr:hypothetical protein D1007_40223 [Hordeum vulgare]
MKTLETKLLINEKKKEVKLAQVEARREDAKHKGVLEERMIKEYKEDITERKRIFRGAFSTLRGDTLMSGGGDGGVEDSTTGDNGGLTRLEWNLWTDDKAGVST